MIPIQEGITQVAQYLRQSVQFGAVLYEHTDFLNDSLFNLANFSNQHYLNLAGVTVNIAVQPANTALGHSRCLKAMVLAGTAAQMRPDGIAFLTVDTMI